MPSPAVRPLCCSRIPPNSKSSRLCSLKSFRFERRCKRRRPSFEKTINKNWQAIKESFTSTCKEVLGKKTKNKTKQKRHTHTHTHKKRKQKQTNKQQQQQQNQPETLKKIEENKKKKEQKLITVVHKQEKSGPMKNILMLARQPRRA